MAKTTDDQTVKFHKPDPVLEFSKFSFSVVQPQSIKL